MDPSSFPTYRIPIGSPWKKTIGTPDAGIRDARDGQIFAICQLRKTSYGLFNENLSLNIPICFFLNPPKWLCVKTLVASTYHHISENNPGTYPSTYHYPIHNHPWLARWWMVILWHMDRFGPSPIQASNSSNSSAPQWNTKYDHEPDICRWFITTPPTKCIWIYMIIDL
jgi:hypothetical protein